MRATISRVGGVPSGAEGLEVRMVLIAVEMRSPALYVDRLYVNHRYALHTIDRSITWGDADYR